MLVYSMICIQSYYESTTMIPQPSSLSSSLALFTRYVASHPYSDIADSIGQDVDDQCDKAQAFNIVFVILLYVLEGCLLTLLIICICGEIVRQRSPKRKRYGRLIYGSAPKILALLSIVSYIICIAAKNVIAFESAAQFEERSEELPTLFPKSSYPFCETVLDVQTILLGAGTMAVIRGNTRQSVSALRFSALASSFYVTLLTPAILGNMYAGAVFDLLASDSQCKKLFDVTYGVNGDLYKEIYLVAEREVYPESTDEDAQGSLCYASRIALLSALILYICQILQCGASGYAFAVNMHRQSEIVRYVYPTNRGRNGNGLQSVDSFFVDEPRPGQESLSWQDTGEDVERKEGPLAGLTESEA
eukprot:scaffold259_cov252-Pinguiococcus_pyrenoidosus.AAC.34